MWDTVRSTFELQSEESETSCPDCCKNCCDPCKNCVQRIQSWLQEPWPKFIVTIVLFLLNIWDFSWDWVFFADVQKMTAGLVYGPPNVGFWWAVLVFCLISTILFLVEVVEFCYTVRERPFTYSPLLWLLAVWIEDIPQVIINLIMVVCREQATSEAKRAKAGAILVYGIVRLLHILLVKPGMTKCVKYSIFLGRSLELVGGIAIFVLVYTYPSDDGVSLQVPKHLFKETFHEREYFANVSVFMNHARYFDPDGMGIPASDQSSPVVNWMRLASIDYVMAEGSGDGLRFSLESEEDLSAAIIKLAWWAKPKSGGGGTTASPPWRISGCYIVNQMDKTVSEVQNPSDCTRSAGFFTDQSRNVYMTFGYTEPGWFFKRQAFGDITFNMRLDSSQGGSRVCRQIQNYTSSLDREGDSEIPLHIRYFKTASNINAQGIRHLLRDGNGFRFFRNDEQDLIDIKHVWKTGWMKCDSMGNLAPSLDRSIQVSCSRED